MCWQHWWCWRSVPEPCCYPADMTDHEPRGELAMAALLTDELRGRLYRLVRRRRQLSRDEAAAELGISRGLAAFHLDKLVAAGLLRARTQAAEGTSPGWSPPQGLRALGPGAGDHHPRTPLRAGRRAPGRRRRPGNPPASRHWPPPPGSPPTGGPSSAPASGSGEGSGGWGLSVPSPPPVSCSSSSATSPSGGTSTSCGCGTARSTPWPAAPPRSSAPSTRPCSTGSCVASATSASRPSSRPGQAPAAWNSAAQGRAADWVRHRVALLPAKH